MLLTGRGTPISANCGPAPNRLVTESSTAIEGYLFATANRGEVLGAMGRVGEGLTALNEARGMAANRGFTPMVQQIEQMMAALRAGQS